MVLGITFDFCSAHISEIPEIDESQMTKKKFNASPEYIFYRACENDWPPPPPRLLLENLSEGSKYLKFQHQHEIFGNKVKFFGWRSNFLLMQSHVTHFFVMQSHVKSNFWWCNMYAMKLQIYHITIWMRFLEQPPYTFFFLWCSNFLMMQSHVKVKVLVMQYVYILEKSPT